MADNFTRTQTPSDAEIINQVLGPRPAYPNPRLPIVSVNRNPPEPGVIPADQFGWGAYVSLTLNIDPVDWGTTLTATPGAAGVGAHGDPAAGGDGADSTITGTLNGITINIVAGGGKGAGLAADGAMGIAAGGDLNINGAIGNYQPAGVGNILASYGGKSTQVGPAGLDGGHGVTRIRYYG